MTELIRDISSTSRLKAIIEKLDGEIILLEQKEWEAKKNGRTESAQFWRGSSEGRNAAIKLLKETFATS